MYDAQGHGYEKLAAALVRVQAEIKVAKKDRTNPFFKSKYADLSSVWEACHEELTKNEIAVIQAPAFQNGVQLCRTILVHSSGQTISGDYLVRPVKDDPQSYGSAFTYARRYSLAAMVGILQDDDDGRIASMTRGKKADTGKVAGALLDREVTKSDRANLARLWREAGIPDADVVEHLSDKYGLSSTGGLTGRQLLEVQDWIKSKKK